MPRVTNTDDFSTNSSSRPTTNVQGHHQTAFTMPPQSRPPTVTDYHRSKSHGIPSNARPYESSRSRSAPRPSRARAQTPSEELIPCPLKPPSTFHNFKGDIKTQDIFIDALASTRRKGEKHRVLLPGGDRFEMERMDMWNHDSICTPCLILQPKTAREVSSCLQAYTMGVRRCLASNRKSAAQLNQKKSLAVPRLCIAGGRNSFNSMKEGSIVLDLSRMRGVSVDVENRTCAVQGGARVEDLDAALGEHGLMAVMGTSPNLGVVGCILGGGVGYASRKHGLASDNVLAAEIVLADGRLKRCSALKHTDLYWSVRGGGGGIGVVVSVTLNCFPLRNATLLTYELTTSSVTQRKNVLRNWANWISGDTGDGDKDANLKGAPLVDNGGAPKEIYSHLMLPTGSSSVSFLGTSIDPEVIPQSEDYLEEFQDRLKQNSRFSPFSLFGGGNDKRLPTSWDRVPGLAELKVNKFGASSRYRSRFRMVRYWDELQWHSNAYWTPGNVFIAYKYAKSMNSSVVDLIARATSGKMSPNNQSRIFVMSAGGAINEIKSSASAFDARSMNYVIFIEGRWNADYEPREAKERKKVIHWVHTVANQLHHCEGILSTTHTESTRDQISKSGKTKPPAGWYNFHQANGSRLLDIKQKRDPRNVFSLASRISWMKATNEESSESSVDTPPLALPKEEFKEGEIDPQECISLASKMLFNNANKMRTSSRTLNKNRASVDDFDNDDDEEVFKTIDEVDKDDDLDDDYVENDGEETDEELKKILSSIEEDSDSDLNEWSLAPVAIKRDSADRNSVDEIAPSSDRSLKGVEGLEKNGNSLALDELAAPRTSPKRPSPNTTAHIFSY